MPDGLSWALPIVSMIGSVAAIGISIWAWRTVREANRITRQANELTRQANERLGQR